MPFGLVAIHHREPNGGHGELVERGSALRSARHTRAACQTGWGLGRINWAPCAREA